jgi:hypothetical protein
MRIGGNDLVACLWYQQFAAIMLRLGRTLEAPLTVKRNGNMLALEFEDASYLLVRDHPARLVQLVGNVVSTYWGDGRLAMVRRADPRYSIRNWLALSAMDPPAHPEFN